MCLEQIIIDERLIILELLCFLKLLCFPLMLLYVSMTLQHMVSNYSSVLRCVGGLYNEQ